MKIPAIFLTHKRTLYSRKLLTRLLAGLLGEPNQIPKSQIPKPKSQSTTAAASYLNFQTSTIRILKPNLKLKLMKAI